jgi:hypothetical protein
MTIKLSLSNVVPVHLITGFFFFIACAHSNVAQHKVVKEWDVLEVAITARNKYTNPYGEIQLPM